MAWQSVCHRVPRSWRNRYKHVCTYRKHEAVAQVPQSAAPLALSAVRFLFPPFTPVITKQRFPLLPHPLSFLAAVLFLSFPLDFPRSRVLVNLSKVARAGASFNRQCCRGAAVALCSSRSTFRPTLFLVNHPNYRLGLVTTASSSAHRAARAARATRATRAAIQPWPTARSAASAFNVARIARQTGPASSSPFSSATIAQGRSESTRMLRLDAHSQTRYVASKPSPTFKFVMDPTRRSTKTLARGKHWQSFDHV